METAFRSVQISTCGSHHRRLTFQRKSIQQILTFLLWLLFLEALLMFPITLFFPAPPPPLLLPHSSLGPFFLPCSAAQMSHERPESILSPVQPAGQRLSRRLRPRLHLHHNKS